MNAKFTWKKIPDTEFDRLEKTLYNHLRAMKVKKTKIERLGITKSILKQQQNTCAFADGDDSFCWNHPKNKDCVKRHKEIMKSLLRRMDWWSIQYLRVFMVEKIVEFLVVKEHMELLEN